MKSMARWFYMATLWAEGFFPCLQLTRILLHDYNEANNFFSLSDNIIFCLIHNFHFSMFTKLTLLTILEITYDTNLWISFLWRKLGIVCLDAYSELSGQSKMIYIDNLVGNYLDVGFCSLKSAEGNAFNTGESWEILQSVFAFFLKILVEIN